MQRYDSYKDSGIQWLGEIPSHWEVSPIKNRITKCYYTCHMKEFYLPYSHENTILPQVMATSDESILSHSLN